MPSLRRGAALVDRHAAALVLPWKLAADADAEDEAPAGQMIERGDLLGDGRWMAQRQQKDGGAEDQALADHGRLRDLRDGVEEGYCKGNVIAAPEGIEAQPIHMLDDLHQLIERRHPGAGRRLGAAQHGVDADLQRTFERKGHLRRSIPVLTDRQYSLRLDRNQASMPASKVIRTRDDYRLREPWLGSGLDPRARLVRTASKRTWISVEAFLVDCYARHAGFCMIASASRKCLCSAMGDHMGAVAEWAQSSSGDALPRTCAAASPRDAAIGFPRSVPTG